MTDPNSPYRPPPHPPAFNAPKVVLWLIGLLVGFHILRMVAPVETLNELYYYLVFIPSDVQHFDYDPVAVTSRWVGHALVHGGWLHLIANCGFLLAFGTPLARQIPTGSFLLLMILGAAAGAWSYILIYGYVEIFLLGASGSVSALVGALSRMVFLRRGNEIVPRPFNNQRSGMIFVLVFIGFNLLFFVLPGPGGTSVSGESHLGGFIAGFLLSLILPWHARGRRGVPAND